MPRVLLLARMIRVKWLTHDRAGNQIGEAVGAARWVRPTGPIPRPRKRELIFDFILAFCLATVMKPVREYTLHIAEFSDKSITKGTTIAVAFAVLIPLCARRRFPLAALWVLMLELVLIPVPLVNVAAAALIAGYSATVYSPYRRTALWSLPVLVVALWTTRYFDLLPGNNNLVIIPIAIPIAAAAAFYGATIRREALTDVAAERRAREERQQEAIRLAVEDERSRIARELHDVVTHNVSVMVVMAGAARKVMEKNPEQATKALLEVEAAGRAAMSELRQVMGLLTEDVRDQHQLAPQPGLGQLGSLVSRTRVTGVPIAYRVVGEARPVPPGLDLTAYRVVQEALTNTVKHASGASVDIQLEYKPAQLVLDISDSGGVPGQTASTGNGRGLIGLRERVAVHGGTVEAGPRPNGAGYRVRVQIPLPVEDAA